KHELINHLRENFKDYRIDTHSLSGGEMFIDFTDTTSFLEEKCNYKVSLKFKVKAKRSKETYWVTKLKKRYKAEKADKPFKYDTIRDIYLPIPVYKLYREPDGGL